MVGQLSLVRRGHPDYTAHQVEASLERAAEVPSDYDERFYGSGFLNLVDAL